MRDIEQQAQIAIGKKVTENAPGVMAEDFAVGERAIDRRPHGAQVALADLRMDRRAGELAVGKLDARRFRRHHHLLQEFGADLVAKPARAAMDGDDDIVLCKPKALATVASKISATA